MPAIGKPTDYIRKLVSEPTKRSAVEEILEKSLTSDDLSGTLSRARMSELGVRTDTALMLLAHHKSKAKYGYGIDTQTSSHLLALAEKKGGASPLGRLFEQPFLLVKACWIYEHAPFFFFCEQGESEDRDALILDFARQYEANFLECGVPVEEWQKVLNPSRIWMTTFWESEVIDPCLLLDDARKNNVEGIELAIDFHPFNFARLLPEEIGPEKRARIKKAVANSGIRMDVHSPIIGPYTPFPDPARGAQRFFDPARSPAIQQEVIELAKDIGSGAVVFHLIDTSNLKAMADLIEKAGGSDLRVTLENYCQIKTRQTSAEFIECANEIRSLLPAEIRKNNFGLTVDVGHFNIEGEDPLKAAETIGKWCSDNRVYFRLHATDNYGDLLFSPPAYSADVHSCVSGRGINNAMVVKLLRSMGHRFDVVAEQIPPLSPKDVATIHDAQTCTLDRPYAALVESGRQKLAGTELGALIEPEVLREGAYQFLAGLEGVPALREHLIYRRIQNKKNLSVEEAKKISQSFMRMPRKFRHDLTSYIDDLLLPIQIEAGAIQKQEKDLICQNISGALFAAINNEHLDQIFSKNQVFRKGDVICEQNKPGREMFYIKEGEVSVHIGGHVALLGPGEIFGEISLFYNTHRSATIIAASETLTVGVLSRNGLERLFRSNRPFAHGLTFRLFNILPERLRNMNEKYKAAIRNLQLIFSGEEKDLPYLEYLQEEYLQKGARQKRAGFFKTLAEKEAQRIFDEIQEVDAGTLVFSEGDAGDGAYYILEGKVKVAALSSDHEDVFLGELGEHEMFGEMALIDEKPRSASVVTLTPCRLGFIGKVAFNEFIATRSGLAFRLMNFICSSLFRHILRLDRIYSEIKKPDPGRL